LIPQAYNFFKNHLVDDPMILMEPYRSISLNLKDKEVTPCLKKNLNFVQSQMQYFTLW